MITASLFWALSRMHSFDLPGPVVLLTLVADILIARYVAVAIQGWPT